MDYILVLNHVNAAKEIVTDILEKDPKSFHKHSITITNSGDVDIVAMKELAYINTIQFEKVKT